MKVVFTDLDGTLLDHQTYSWAPARSALARLKRHRVPWIIVTSKTRAEVEILRTELGNEHPFIVENGGAVYIPKGYFGFCVEHAVTRGGYEVLEWGRHYRHVVDALRDASRLSGCRVRGFHDMTPEEVSVFCDLPLDRAVLAKWREFDEAFHILDPERSPQLCAAVRKKGLRCERGGRLWHCFGGSDKASAVHALQKLFKRIHGLTVTIGLGDTCMDSEFLNAVIVPVVVRSEYSDQLKATLPGAFLTEKFGPEGWNEAVLKLIPD
jgi:mannosyl-3-phosphoglycerate phosphatase